VLTDQEKTHARRFLGYPAFGENRNGSMGLQTYQSSSGVEYRLGNLSSAEEGVLRQYLGTLASLERAIPEAAIGLDTSSAAEWVRNPAELSERTQLFDDWRRRLAAFLGVPQGPDLGRSNNVRLVV